jgi:hypothetical protein
MIPDYQQKVDAYNERRRKRREDPEYRQRGYDRIKAQKARREAENRGQRRGEKS